MRPMRDINKPFTTGIYSSDPAFSPAYTAAFGINNLLPHDHSLRSKSAVQAKIDVRLEQLQLFRQHIRERGYDPDDPELAATWPSAADGLRQLQDIVDFYQDVLNKGNWEAFG